MADRALTVALSPLYYEPEAAQLVGIEPRTLRSEREAGRIGYRRVAGRVMYRIDDLTAWQEAVACPARPKDRSSGHTKSAAARSTSSGPTSRADEAGSVQRALATTARLRRSLRTGSQPASGPSTGPAPVVLLRQG